MSNLSSSSRKEELNVENRTNNSDEIHHISALLRAYTGRETELLQELKRRIECRRALKKQKEEQECKGSNIANNNNDDLINSKHIVLDEISNKSLIIMDDQLSSELDTSPLLGNMTLESIKRDVENSMGFASPLHRLRWEEAWFGTLPLSNFIRNWGNDILHHGMGYKMTRSGGFVLRWVKRYFVLAWSLLYVFDGNKGMDRCRGAVYMYRAQVKKTEVIGRPAIVITPATQKKPSELGKEKFASFTMTVEAPRLLDIWYNALRKTSAVEVLTDSVRAGSVIAPFSTLEEGPQQSLSPIHLNKTPVNPQEQETVTYVDIQIPNVASNAGESKEQLEQDEGIPLSSPSQQQRQQQQQRGQENSEKEFSIEKDRQTIIEDYRRQLQTITVSASLVKERLSRIATKKDKRELGEVLLKFILSHVDDAAGLWSLMGQVENLSDSVPQNKCVSTSLSRSSSSSSSSDISQLVREQQLILSNSAKKSASVEYKRKYNTPFYVDTPTPKKKQHVLLPKEENGNKQEIIERSYDNNDFVGNVSLFPTAVSGEGGEISMGDDLERQRRIRRLRERQQDIESILSELPTL